MTSLYSTAALERGENVALFLFEERVETFFRRSEGPGMNLRLFHDKGQLTIRDFNPKISPGEFAQIVQTIVTQDHTRVVVIDSFTGYLNSLPHRDKAVRDIQSLLKYLARAGALTMLIVAQHGLLGQNVGIDVDVSFLGDTVLLLKLTEHDGRLRRNITVVKKRHGPHDLDVHELLSKARASPSCPTTRCPKLERLRSNGSISTEPDPGARALAPGRRYVYRLLVEHDIQVRICSAGEVLAHHSAVAPGVLVATHEALTPIAVSVVADHLSHQPS
jgi:archaellum biogenesis ATPase FlaH